MNEPLPLTDDATHLLKRASDNAMRLRCGPPTAEHIVMSVMKKPPSLAGYILDDLGIDVDLLRNVIEEICTQSQSTTPSLGDVTAVTERARSHAKRNNDSFPFVCTEHVLLGALQLGGSALRDAFDRFGISLEDAITRVEASLRKLAVDGILPSRKLENALKDCNKAIELDPEDAKNYVARSRVHALERRFNEALDDVTKAIELDEHLLKAYYIRGLILCEIGELDRALTDCNKAVEMSPKGVGAYILRGRVYFADKRFDEAIDDLTRAITLDPKSAEAHVLRAHARQEKGDFASAIDDCNSSIRLAPGSAQGFLFRAALYRDMGKLEEYEADNRTAIQLLGVLDKK